MPDATASPSSDSAMLARTSPAVLYQTLGSAPELDVFTATVTGFVEQQRAVMIAAGVRPKAYTGFGPLTMVLDTLLKALAWQALDALGRRRLDDAALLALRDAVLGSEAASSLGRQLHTTLGWDEQLAGQPVEPVLLRQLVWCALLLELEPPSLRLPAWLAGYDLCAARNWGLDGEQLYDALIDHLQWRTRDIENNRCENMARLALCLLTPLHPQLIIRAETRSLRCGTLIWASVMHGVALAETLQPGSAARMDITRLAALPVEAAQGADTGAQQLIAQTRIPAALQWAVAQGKLAHCPDGRYSSEQVQVAMRALDNHAAQAAQSIQAVLTPAPDRKVMAQDRFGELFGITAGIMRYLRMYPTTFGKRLEYALRHPAPGVPAGEFLLLDLFAAGHMKNGRDLFEFKPTEAQKPAAKLLLASIDRLKGIDLPELFDQAFDAWFKQARRGYAFIIESLLGQVPRADQLALARGRVQLFVLQAETRMSVDRESDEDRLLKRARYGFVLQCTDRGQMFSYEVFPLLNMIVRRGDLAPLPTSVALKREYAYSTQAGASVDLDWTAYFSGSAPRPGMRSHCIVVQCAVFDAQPDLAVPDTLGLQQLRAISQTAAHHHLFFHRQSLYVQQRRVAWIERVERTYPPVLRVVEVLVPGLGCLNALHTNEAPVVACTLEVASLTGLPLLRLASGALKVSLRAGRLVFVHSLPAYAKALLATRQAGAGTAARLASRLRGLPGKPVFFRWPQRVNGRLGYPLGGQRQTVRPAGLGRKIDDVKQFDDFVKQDNIFAGREQVRLDMRAEVEAGADIRVYVRRDGSRTMVRRDSVDDSFIDLADNTTISIEPQYDFRIIKTWKVAEHDARQGVIQVPVDRVSLSRSTLDPKRLASVREAIENGTPLPALVVERNAHGYSVINGNHRLQVARDLKLERVPVKVHVPAQPVIVPPVTTILDTAVETTVQTTVERTVETTLEGNVQTTVETTVETTTETTTETKVETRVEPGAS